VSSSAGALPGIVRVAATPPALADEAASWLARRSEEARFEHGYFAIALSGGATPRGLYQRLTEPPYREGIAWATWMVFYADERAVPPDSEQSNHHLAQHTLLRHVPIPPERVHRIEADKTDREQAAREYASLLADTLPRGPGGAPRLHCALLGLGENGHTASLFPGSPALQAQRRWAVPAEADYEPRARITLTLPALNAAESVVFLVTGATKGPPLRGVVEGTVPAALVRPADGLLLWLLDAEAAAAMADAR